MNKLWPTLFSFIFFFSCINKPEVEELNKNTLLLKRDTLQITYRKDEGGYLEKAEYANKVAFHQIKESFPNEKHNFRLSSSRSIHDQESIVARTFHPKPELSVNRSIFLKKNTLELIWHFKNTSKQAIPGTFELSINLATKAELEELTQGCKLSLDNGLEIIFEHSNKLRTRLLENKLLIDDPKTRIIKPLHRDLEKIRIHFSEIK